MKKISIVIVSFNTKNLLGKCLDSIIENTTIDYEIIVVDNASTDGSAKMVKEKYSKIILIENNQNLGFSKANNIAVKKSIGEYVLFLNSDTEIPENTLGEMIFFMDKNSNVGASTCYVRLPNGKLDDASHRGFPTPWNSIAHFSGISKMFPRSQFLNGYNMGFSNLEKPHEIDACAGAFMLVRRKAGDEVGWWDEDYFWYGEDLDFCYRLKQKGWKIFFVPNVYILHYKGASGGIKKISKEFTTASDETKKNATNARFSAMKIFYNKHYENKYPKIINWLVIRGINFRSLFK